MGCEWKEACHFWLEHFIASQRSSGVSFPFSLGKQALRGISTSLIPQKTNEQSPADPHHMQLGKVNNFVVLCH